jgi:hypothetical protein
MEHLLASQGQGIALRGGVAVALILLVAAAPHRRAYLRLQLRARQRRYGLRHGLISDGPLRGKIYAEAVNRIFGDLTQPRAVVTQGRRRETQGRRVVQVRVKMRVQLCVGFRQI